VEIDSQGRVLLPQILRSKAKLDAEVNVMGKVTFIDVHNAESFEKQQMPPNGEISLEAKQKVAAILNG
jgi:MraZ protein